MSALRFDGQVAVVTGGGRGIGRAHALALAGRGAAVVVNDTGRAVDGSGPRDATAAETVAAEIEAAGGRAVASSADVATAAGAGCVVDLALAAFGDLHVVVNNAGIAGFRQFADTSEDQLRRQLALDPLAAFNVTHAAWEHLTANGYGRILFTSSSAAFGGPLQAAYGTGKASLIGLARSVAASGASLGIRANVLLPYAFSRMTFLGASLPEEVVRLRERLATPEQVAAVAIVLAHRSCPANGELVVAGGGRVCRIVLAETPGILDPGLTPERVLESWDAIAASDGAIEVGDVDSFEARFYGQLPGWAEIAARTSS